MPHNNTKRFAILDEPAVNRLIVAKNLLLETSGDKSLWNTRSDHAHAKINNALAHLTTVLREMSYIEQ